MPPSPIRNMIARSCSAHAALAVERSLDAGAGSKYGGKEGGLPRRSKALV
jgi:hypothetical protein